MKLDGLQRKCADDEGRLRLGSIEWLCNLPLRHRDTMKARINLKSRSAFADVSFTVGFSDLEGKRVLSYNSDLENGVRFNLPQPGAYSVDIEVSSLPLPPGTYNLDFVCRSGNSHDLDYVPAAFQLEIVAGPRTPGYLFGSLGGVRDAGTWTWNGGVTSLAHSGQVERAAR